MLFKSPFTISPFIEAIRQQPALETDQENAKERKSERAKLIFLVFSYFRGFVIK